jgi:DNA-binding transcriptional ArsR family regulator
MKKQSFSNLARTFSSLSAEPRITILKIIRDKQLTCSDPQNASLSESCCSVGEIAKQLNMPISTVSYHLKEIKHTGLINTIKKGKNVYCSINTETTGRLAEFFNTISKDIVNISSAK